MSELESAAWAKAGAADDNASRVPEGIINELNSRYESSAVLHDSLGQASAARPNDNASKHSDGNERVWTAEEMANATPMPLPVLEIDGDGKLQRQGRKSAGASGTSGDSAAKESAAGSVARGESGESPAAPASMAQDRKEGQEGWPIRNHYLLSNEQKNLIDNYLKDKGLNEYGDPQGTMYAGGTPLREHMSGRTRDRYDYLVDKLMNKVTIQGLDLNKLIRATY